MKVEFDTETISSEEAGKILNAINKIYPLYAISESAHHESRYYGLLKITHVSSVMGLEEEYLRLSIN